MRSQLTAAVAAATVAFAGLAAAQDTAPAGTAGAGVTTESTDTANAPPSADATVATDTPPPADMSATATGPGTAPALEVQTEADMDARRRGFEASLSGGVGGFVRDDSAAFRDMPDAGNHLFYPGFGAQAHLGYRVHRWFSVGGRFAWQNNTTRDLPMGATGSSANSFAAGVYTRFYIGSLLRWEHWEPWAGIGFDPWAEIHVHTNTPIGTVRTRFTAVAIPITVGFAYNFDDRAALGLMAQVSPWIPWRGCTTPPGGGYMCSGDGLGGNTYLYGGLEFRYTFGGHRR